MAESEGCLLRKIHHGIVGMPDRELLGPRGQTVQIEFKVPGEGPSKIQRYQQDRLRVLGHRVENVNSVGAFCRVLASLLTSPSDYANMQLSPGGPGGGTKDGLR